MCFNDVVSFYILLPFRAREHHQEQEQKTMEDWQAQADAEVQRYISFYSNSTLLTLFNCESG